MPTCLQKFLEFCGEKIFKILFKISRCFKQIVMTFGGKLRLYGKSALAQAATAQNAMCAMAMIILTFGQRHDGKLNLQAINVAAYKIMVIANDSHPRR